MVFKYYSRDNKTESVPQFQNLYVDVIFYYFVIIKIKKFVYIIHIRYVNMRVYFHLFLCLFICYLLWLYYLNFNSVFHFYFW